jgi:hypothetical protein
MVQGRMMQRSNNHKETICNQHQEWWGQSSGCMGCCQGDQGKKIILPIAKREVDTILG